MSLANPPSPDVAGFVLAGGKSTRMGRDKVLIELNGQPLIGYAVNLLQSAGLPVFISGARPDLASFASIVPDTEEDRGPLHGVCSALASTEAQYAVFTSVDLPLLPGSLIQTLLRYARTTKQMVTLVSVNGFAQTFPVVLRREALPSLERELMDGKAGCFRAFERAAVDHGQSILNLHVENLVQAGEVVHPAALPLGSWFLNLNTPDDLVVAEHWLKTIA